MVHHSQTWSTLFNYEARDLIRRRFKERHGGEANAGLAREISCNLAQGREYFRSAASADQISKPLLLYYGVLNLARGATLFLSKNKREATLDAGHGLTTSAWPAVLTRDTVDIGDLRVALGMSGTLREFAEATGNKTLLRTNTSVVNKEWEHSGWVGQVSLSLDDILKRLPDVADQYRRWKSDLLHLSAELKTEDGQVRVTIARKQHRRSVTDRDIANVFVGTDYGVIGGEPDKYTIVFAYKPERFPAVWDRVSDQMLGIGEARFVARFSQDCDLSKPIATFTLAYILGMLVRYYPTTWITIVRSERHDAALPTLLESVAYIESRFPMMICDFLERDREAAIA
jgi:hypothetical protein